MWILTVLFGLAGLGIIIFVHELGHFVAAKGSGIAVETFSLGWGKKLVGFNFRGTSYQISWFPLGGYCKMKGELLRPSATEETLQEARMKTDTFIGAPAWKRILVSAAGPLANFVFAVIVTSLIWWIGFNVHTSGNRIILVSDHSLDTSGVEWPATRDGLKTGDRVVKINDEAIDNFWHLSELVRENPGRALLFTVERENQYGATDRISLQVVPREDPETALGSIGAYSWVEPVAGSVEKGKPAALAGLLPGDRIISVDGTEVRHEVDFYQSLQGKGDRIDLVYSRNGEEYASVLILEADTSGMLDLGLGFQQDIYRSPRKDIGGALLAGLQRTGSILRLAGASFAQLVKLQTRRLDDIIAGPIRITQMVGEAATGGFSFGIGEGFVSYFRFLALISIIIALMNLLPIPLLDGGMIIMNSYIAFSSWGSA
jgi:regulator of sigma E protease